MSSTASINRILLITVIVLAAALAAVLVYFLAPKPPLINVGPNSTQNQTSPQTNSTSQSSSTTQTVSFAEAFERGVENWLGLICIYNKYGGNTTLNTVNSIYIIAYNYLYYYEQTNNITYLLMYPIAQYQYLANKYPGCAVNESDQYLANVVMGALSNINTMAYTLNVPGNLLGTPLFIVLNKANNITYVLAGASPLVFYAINYSKLGNVTTFTYQGQELGYGFRANSTQVSFIRELASSGLGIGNPSANITVIEFLDPECPYCAIFQLEYGGYLDKLISSGSIYYVIQYFPTHVLGYGCSSQTIAQMLGPYCG
ncbi:thioredoxin domain-containing protein [Vulcanisaeta sp. JCM 16159]|uniref:thioredoxin domain-containing protein n=1 Tax=Vulcanisaeta sp. JCM 16159 TaxID=1295371 RepID=UPI0006CF7D64|nr:thioredoxin domain-containing protein [Vulcanisaeta sp. JCM 16159]